MEREFGTETVEARNAVRSLLASPARLVGATSSTLTEAYDLSVRKNHDVYDTFLLAVAIERDADYLLTTDTDFETLCADESVTYHNPVPAPKRDRLSEAGG